MSQEEQLIKAYLEAINTGHQESQNRLKIAAFIYTETGNIIPLSTRLKTKFIKGVKPYCDFIINKHNKKGKSNGGK